MPVGDGVGAGELDPWPASSEARRPGAGGSTPMTRILGLCSLAKVETPGQAAAAQDEDGVHQRQLLDDLHGDGVPGRLLR